MTTRAQKVRLGIFMLLALLLLAGSVITLAGLKLWNPRDRYSVSFTESVSGLESGSTVKMSGVRVGQVEKISIDPKDVAKVVVTLSLNPGTPVKTDTRAVMTAIGITGLKFVELTGGSALAKAVKPGSTIPPGKSTMRTLTGKATDIATKSEAVLNNLLSITGQDNQARLRKLLDNVDTLAVTYTKLADGKVPQRIRRILSHVDRMTLALERAAKDIGGIAKQSAGRVDATLAAAESAAKAINRSVAGLRPQATLNEINRAARALKDQVANPAIGKMVTSLNGAATRLAGLSGELSKVVRRRDRQLVGILSKLNDASAELKRFARAIREQPSLLLRGATRKERDVR